MSKSIIYLTDRSGEELDDRCGMAFWWNRKEGGKGIVSTEDSLAQRLGIITHDDLATVAGLSDEELNPVALQERIDEILAPLTDDDKRHTKVMEQLYRRLGWMAAFALFIEPPTRAEWDTIALEDDIILDRDPWWCSLTPDRVLRNKDSKRIVYREYKTTISAGSKWQQHWRYDIQLHAGMKALEEELKEQIAFSQIMGLQKGYETSTGRLSHPYVWAYLNQATGEWDHKYQASRDWVPIPVWEYPDGIVKWVLKCGKDEALAQFPLSAPVMLDEKMVERWVARRKARHIHIALVEDACRTDHLLRAVHFPQITAQCRPAFGDACQYLGACWNAQTGLEPLRSGHFIPRTPHHAIEQIGIEEDNSE